MGIRKFLTEESRHLTKVNISDRPWELPIAAALASGMPVLAGIAYDQLGLGLVASIGGLVFLHLPSTRLSHRMAWVMACAFGMIASFALGLAGHFVPALIIPLLVVISILVTMVCRYYAAPPPGSLFFIMAAAIAAYSPVHGHDALLQVGALALGTVLAVVVAFFYSLYIVSRHGVPEPTPPIEPDFDYVVVDSTVIGAFVGLSLLAAHALQLDRPYWVPVSCMAVIQGASLRAAWTRQVHRVIGTALGLVVYLGIARLSLSPWGVAGMLMTLTVIVELLVVRHYGLAAVFITPLTVLLAEAGQQVVVEPHVLMQARFVDTVLGAVIGLAGSVCLHSPRFRAAAGATLRKILPGDSKSA